MKNYNNNCLIITCICAQPLDTVARVRVTFMGRERVMKLYRNRWNFGTISPRITTKQQLFINSETRTVLYRISRPNLQGKQQISCETRKKNAKTNKPLFRARHILSFPVRAHNERNHTHEFAILRADVIDFVTKVLYWKKEI